MLRFHNKQLHITRHFISPTHQLSKKKKQFQLQIQYKILIFCWRKDVNIHCNHGYKKANMRATDI